MKRIRPLLAIGLFGFAVSVSAARLDFGKTTHAVLPNGLAVVIIERHEIPLVELLAVVKGGSSMDPPGKAGLTSLTVEGLRRGAGSRGAMEMEEAIDALGAELSTQTGRDDSRVGLNLLSKDLPSGLDLLADLLQRPRFEVSEVEKQRSQTLARIEEEKDDPGSVATLHFTSALFDLHPYAHPTEGTRSTVSKLSREELVSQHAEWFVPENVELVIVGDVAAPAALAAVTSRFGAWARKSPPRIDLPAPAAPQARSVQLLDKPDATQSQVCIGGIGIPRSDPSWEALVLANTALGGGFTSRLEEKLRVDMSLTYGVGSVMPADRQSGPLFLQTFTPTETTRKIIDAAFEVLTRFRAEGPTAEELERARGYRSGVLAIRLQYPRAVADSLADEWVFGLPLDSLATTLDRYDAVTLPQAKAAALRYTTADALIVVLGKAQTVKPQLTGLGPITVEPYTREP
jgi:zinc protease